MEFLINEFPEMMDCTTDCGKTAAACATEIGNVEILRILLSRGAKIKSNGMDRTNILDCCFGDLEKAEGTIIEIINFCTREKKLKTLQEVFIKHY